MSDLLLKNCRVLYPREGKIKPVKYIKITNGIISYMGDQPIESSEILDVANKIVMPGLCDAHVHVTAITADLSGMAKWSPSRVIARSIPVMEEMLLRGFTTVRDAGGADYGIVQAVDEGYIKGPRILFCGHALSQTGGHGDGRDVGESHDQFCYLSPELGRIADGITEVRKAARDEIRRGANQIKIMASGGVASPTDRIDSTQYSAEEIRAIVEEAEAANLYVMAHSYTARAINHALSNGVRSIEHGNLLNESCIPLFKKYNAYLVPTLSTYYALKKEGVDDGLPERFLVKLDEVLEGGLKALKLAYDSGINIVYGTDLLGKMHKYQLNEFKIRSEVIPAVDLIRQATCNAADLFNMTGKIGELIEGAFADILVLEHNPLDNIEVFMNPENIKIIMKEGRIFKNTL
ncbi:MAG: amidohydrolase family protein [Candidatus Heimdallarchaeota archaeon]|nr:amidohydrolase family protein [Candidatus Heimdallarchaeota archaeon]